MSYAELKKKYVEMERNFQRQLADLHKEVLAAQKNEQADALQKIRAMMRDFGLSQGDIGDAESGKKNKLAKPEKAKRPVPVKFRGPNGEEWSGRGRAPKWIEHAEREQFRVKED